jgi:hypothetical protein
MKEQRMLLFLLRERILQKSALRYIFTYPAQHLLTKEES